MRNANDQFRVTSKFPYHGIFGLIIIFISETLLFLKIKLIGWYFTPLVWTGYILFIDAIQVKFIGVSLIKSRRIEFLLMLPWSIFCWLIFEAYNLYLLNWKYIGLPENIILRLIGYGWSFATIFPAILETTELFEKIMNKKENKSYSFPKYIIITSIILGVCLLTVPLILEQSIAAKLFAFVWLGFIFFLDPINVLLGGNSILKQWVQKDFTTTLALIFAGILCGILWEFWNYWAIAKWTYNVPISFVGPKIFEMPLLGYLGFIPFAFEVWVMQEFLISIFPKIRQ